MMNRYAQINEHGICVSDSMLSGAVDAPNMIPLAADAPSPIGRRWAGGEWEDVQIPARPRIVITQIVCSDPEAAVDLDAGEVTCAEGAIVAATAELRMPDGSLLPLSAAFRMPLVARDGRERILRAQFVGGVAEIAATLPDSGCWRVTEETINQDLPVEQRMDFGGLDIYVV
jgi:hypothetical protein